MLSRKTIETCLEMAKVNESMWTTDDVEKDTNPPEVIAKWEIMRLDYLSAIRELESELREMEVMR
ncbi:MAG: hypothetical protein A2Y53_00035 [Chloroflexi bacterium RBG_16_47_49]|nr:MAG: hypothetical protein A2Y53_00035 [Chloroflexi bacterium RBG_16_47_49]